MNHGLFELISFGNEGVFTLMTTSAFLMSTVTFLDDDKEWSGLYFDTHQLGIMSNFDVNIKILLSM